MAGYKISKWGNSNAIRIPRDILKQLAWDTDTEIQFTIKDNSLILEKHTPYDLDVLLQDYRGNYQCKEMDWGLPKGNELW